MKANSDTGNLKAAMEYAKAEALPGLAVQFLKKMLNDVNAYQKAEVDLQMNIQNETTSSHPRQRPNP